jgi:hypothetical protein
MSDAAPRRIRRSRAKGARLPENTICVDRSTKWGNPFIVGVHGTRAHCVDFGTDRCWQARSASATALSRASRWPIARW